MSHAWLRGPDVSSQLKPSIMHSLYQTCKSLAAPRCARRMPHALTVHDRGHVRTITLRLFPTAACEVQCKCKKYFATRPGPRTPTGVRQEMQTVFQQEHAAYDRSLRQSPTAAAEWAKPREIRRGTSVEAPQGASGCRTAVSDHFNTHSAYFFSSGKTRATCPTGPPRPGAPGY